jgi:hypothetical protein
LYEITFKNAVRVTKTLTFCEKDKKCSQEGRHGNIFDPSLTGANEMQGNNSSYDLSIFLYKEGRGTPCWNTDMLVAISHISM